MRTFIRWHEPWSDEPGALRAEHGHETVEVATIDEALAWAAERGPQVSVVVGDEAWDEVPDGEARRRIDARIARDRERYAGERRRYDEPVEWFWALLEPDTDDPEGLAATVAAAPTVLSARVTRRQRRRGEETWLVVRVTARTQDEASTIALDAVIERLWPASRMDAELPEGPYFLRAGRGGYQVTGLPAYELDEVG